MTDAQKIVRVISIRDTRQYEEQGDRWVPIPGSGTESQCHRCGRTHEVHATVLLDDGAEVVVGTGCASKDDAEAAKRFASLDSAAKRLARLEAELEDYRRRKARWDLNWAGVQLLPLPEVREVPLGWTITNRTTASAKRFEMGEATVVCHDGVLHEERLSCLREQHWTKLMAERGMPSVPRTKTANIENQIKQVKRRMEEKQAEELV